MAQLEDEMNSDWRGDRPGDREKIVAIAQEQHSETLEIKNDAEVRQEAGGCWVAAWVWIENVYIEEVET